MAMSKMKKLSDFEGEKSIVIAAKVFDVFMGILADERNTAQKTETNPVKMFSAFMQNSPKEMKKIFAILSEEDVETYNCNGADAMLNILMLANDPVLVGLFLSQGQTGDAKSSASVSENTKE